VSVRGQDVASATASIANICALAIETCKLIFMSMCGALRGIVEIG
jgi:hypothetical protein